MARTVIHKGLEAKWGDEDHLEVSQAQSFTQMVFEALSERKPTPDETKLFDLILNLSIDHGPDSPSGSATIQASKDGKGMGEAVGEGVSKINESHGGAIKPAMENLYRVKSQESRVKEMVEQYLKEGKRIPGFGHRIYKQSLPSNDGKESDPRAQLIFEKMVEMGFDKDFIEIAKEIRQEIFNQSGKALTINIDGAIAVVLCSFGWEAKLGNAVFIIARVPGLCGHYLNKS